MIEGRLRYVVRCYLKAEGSGDGSEKIYKRRYLSLIPKENEYGIVRGINENNLPSDIPLDAHLFLETIGVEKDSLNKKNEDKESVTVEVKEAPKTSEIKKPKAKKAKVEPEVKEVEPEKRTVVTTDGDIGFVSEVLKPAKEEPKEEPVNKEVEVKSAAPAQSNDDKIAEIKRKIEMLRKQRGENK